MKKYLKRIAVGVLVVIVLFVAFSVWMKNKFEAETRNMKAVPTAKVADGVFAIQDKFVNVFLVKDGDDCVAFDAGNEMKTVERGMTALKLDPGKVKAVFLTHTDGDHVGALKLFPNATVYISVLEEQMLNGKTHRFFLFNNKISTSYKKMDDNQTITVGKIQVKGVMTPGHTPGSMCFIVNEKYLFTGDTLGLRDGAVTKFNDFFNMDTKTEEQSIRKLALLKNVKLILTAHYGVSSDFEKAFHSWR
jgi:glyoxylase-like metal-dependent hydrolase (beta-lactamase superfamily II)